MAERGLASILWRKYDPHPVPYGWKPKANIRLVRVDGKPSRVDPMCDYIEGAEWWLARSDRSVRKLLQQFDQLEVACLLYERVGAMAELGKEGDQFKIAIQLVRDKKDNWDLDVSLSDSGIYLEELYTESE